MVVAWAAADKHSGSRSRPGSAQGLSACVNRCRTDLHCLDSHHPVRVVDNNGCCPAALQCGGVGASASVPGAAILQLSDQQAGAPGDCEGGGGGRQSRGNSGVWAVCEWHSATWYFSGKAASQCIRLQKCLSSNMFQKSRDRLFLSGGVSRNPATLTMTPCIGAASAGVSGPTDDKCPLLCLALCRSCMCPTGESGGQQASMGQTLTQALPMTANTLR